MNLQVNEGETHVLMGPNGAGKSTLGYAMMGNPDYNVTGGQILFNGEDIRGYPPTSAPRRVCSCPSRIRWRSPA